MPFFLWIRGYIYVMYMLVYVEVKKQLGTFHPLAETRSLAGLELL